MEIMRLKFIFDSHTMVVSHTYNNGKAVNKYNLIVTINLYPLTLPVFIFCLCLK